MQLVIFSGGVVRTLYSEMLDLAVLGTLQIERASMVEPNMAGEWLADLSPVSGPVLGPFPRRSQALAAEQAWLEANWLTAPDSDSD